MRLSKTNFTDEIMYMFTERVFSKATRDSSFDFSDPFYSERYILLYFRGFHKINFDQCNATIINGSVRTSFH